MSVKKTFLMLAFVFAVPAFVAAMTNEGALTDTTTTTTSSGSYNDDGTASARD
jgi:hypothetical protein